MIRRPFFAAAISLHLMGAAAAFPSSEARLTSSVQQNTRPVAIGDGDLALARDWASAVWDHRAGVDDEAAKRVAAHSSRDLIAALSALQCLSREWGDTHDPAGKTTSSSAVVSCGKVTSTAALDDLLGITGPDRADLNQLLLRGILLHTDIALLMLPTGASSTSSGVVAVEDGMSGRTFNASVHWEIARTLLDWTTGPVHQEAATRWYRAIAAVLAQEWRFGEAAPNLQHGLVVLPHDARLQFYNAVMHEYFGGTRVQNTVASAILPLGKSLGIGSAKEELAVALAMLEHVLAADPKDAEARLHYGHVLDGIGRHADAIRELQRAAPALADRDLQFDVTMFLGRAQGALGRRAEAEAEFERAAALFPRAQSAQIALSQLAQQAHDSAHAIASVTRTLEWQGQGIDDPWSRYDVSHVRTAADDVSALRSFLTGGRAKEARRP